MGFDFKNQRFRCETCGKLIAKENIEFCNNCECACHPTCKEQNQGLCKNCLNERRKENVQPESI